MKLYKFIFKYLTPITFSTFVLGLLTNITLAADKRWFHDSISYLGTKTSTRLSFFLFLSLTSVFNFIFQVAVVKFPEKLKQMTNLQKIGSVLNISMFTVACVSIIVAGAIPFTLNSDLHYDAAIVYFGFYPAGVLLWGLLNIRIMKNAATSSIILATIILVGGGILKELVPNYVLLQFTIIFLFASWNLYINFSINKFIDSNYTKHI